MTTSLIQDVLFQRLVKQERENDEFALYLLAACEGPAALAAYVEGRAEPRAQRQGRRCAATRCRRRMSRTSRSAVSRYRRRLDLRLTPGPGVTLVIGRNGSGKSSFAEAAEVAFTGTSARWAAKGSTEWQRGGATCTLPCHHVSSSSLVQQGIGAKSRVERTWRDPRLQVRRVTARRRRQEEGGAGQHHMGRPARTLPAVSQLQRTGGHARRRADEIYEALLAGLGLDEFVRVRDCCLSPRANRASLGHRPQDRRNACRGSKGARGHTCRRTRFAQLATLLDKKTRDVDAIDALVSGRQGDEADW